MWWWWSDHGVAPWMFLGPMMMFIFVIICMAMMFFMMRGRTRHGGRGGYALEILKERYARGEINQQEFEERRRVLDT